jgi:hypothetical protein
MIDDTISPELAEGIGRHWQLGDLASSAGSKSYL